MSEKERTLLRVSFDMHAYTRTFISAAVPSPRGLACCIAEQLRRMLTYAHVCSRMLTYAWMLMYADACMLMYAETYAFYNCCSTFTLTSGVLYS